MGDWRWVKQKVFGEVFHGNGESLTGTEGGMTNRLNLQLSDDDGRVFLLAASSGLLSKRVVYSKIEVNEDDLERLRAMLADARVRIHAQRAELARR